MDKSIRQAYDSKIWGPEVHERTGCIVGIYYTEDEEANLFWR